MRISDWSSDVCSSDLRDLSHGGGSRGAHPQRGDPAYPPRRAECLPPCASLQSGRGRFADDRRQRRRGGAGDVSGRRGGRRTRRERPRARRRGGRKRGEWGERVLDSVERERRRGHQKKKTKKNTKKR